jgi:hypothetical protein
MRIFTLDNTFGYNPRRAGLAYSLPDRLAIVQKLDDLGIDYVEAGCPAAAGSAQRFFDYARTGCNLAHTRLVALARIDAVREPMERDEDIHAAIDAGTPTVLLSACCWYAGMGGFEEYCRRIADAVRFLKTHALEVIFRDEDFFHCYAHDAVFALRTLEAAKAAGADVLCLRDSSGRGLPHLVREACLEVRKRFAGRLGISAHDDSDLAVANSLEAVEQGFTHVEGSMDSAGMRRGLASLGSLISTLEHQLGHTTIGPGKLDAMAEVARMITEAGAAASERRVLVGLDPHTSDDSRPFRAEHYELTSHSGLSGGVVTVATTTVQIRDTVRSETEEGDGAINALERSLRQCLFAPYPEVAAVRVAEYSVAALDPAQGTASPVRVTLVWETSGERWVSSGVAVDPIEAAWLALTDGFLAALARAGKTAPPVTDSLWAV